MEASGTPSHRVGEDRSTTPAPNGAPGLPLARSSPGLRPRPARLTKCSTVRRHSSSTCRARSGCSAPKRFRGMPRTANTEQLPRLRHGRELHDIRNTSGVLPSNPDGWLRSPRRGGPGIARRARRTQGASYAPSASADPTGSRPRAVRALSRRDRARCARPTSRVPRRGSTEPTAAARRFRNRRSSPSSPHPETAVRLGRSAGEDIDNVRRITPISAGRFFDRTALDLLLTPKAAGHFAATRRAILRAAAPTRDPRFNDFSLCVSVMPPLLRASDESLSRRSAADLASVLPGRARRARGSRSRDAGAGTMTRRAQRCGTSSAHLDPRRSRLPCYGPRPCQRTWLSARTGTVIWSIGGRLGASQGRQDRPVQPRHASVRLGVATDHDRPAAVASPPLDRRGSRRT